jgi:hypothetical protein
LSLVWGFGRLSPYEEWIVGKDPAPLTISSASSTQMNAGELTSQLGTAFGDAPWPHASPPEEIGGDNALRLAEELFLISDATKKFELPRLMCFATSLEGSQSHLNNRLLCRLIEFLDVAFHDPDGTNDLLISAKRRAFASYTDTQSLVILRWLEYVKISFELPDCEDLLTSAIKYWRIRAASHTR